MVAHIQMNPTVLSSFPQGTVIHVRRKVCCSSFLCVLQSRAPAWSATSCCCLSNEGMPSFSYPSSTWARISLHCTCEHVNIEFLGCAGAAPGPPPTHTFQRAEHGGWREHTYVVYSCGMPICWFHAIHACAISVLYAWCMR